MEKLLSVICPVYNEKEFITGVLKFFIDSRYNNKELLIIDGLSDDGTREIVRNWCEKYPDIRMIDNPNKTVPYALNIGIKESRGDIIIRIDAHCDYAVDYLEQIVQTFNEVDADIVGGPTRVAVGNHFQNAVGAAISSQLGVGNSKVHNFNFKGYTDHVTFGAWKREIFNDVGYFDERLVRNQDDEFHYRAKSLGKKIYLNPDIKLWYHPRKTVSGLFKQYYQYGYYKPLVLLKVKSEIKLRHLIPSLFVIYIFSLPIMFVFPHWIIPLVLYFLLVIIKSFSSNLHFLSKTYFLFVYPVIHISYGLGFLARLFNLNGK